MPSESIDQRIASYVQKEFQDRSDPLKAAPMAAYMKTEMSFYGIQKPDRMPIYRALKKDFRPASRKEYESSVLALWSLEHREEKYAAIEYATFFDQFITSDSLPLYERMIREGQWWDFVDPIATALAGTALRKERAKVEPIMDQWIGDANMWIRRTAILSQNKHKLDTNEKMLFQYCLSAAHEKEFFIRKAIGWALREYSYTAPQAVHKFLQKSKHVLSPLSLKEGAKRLNRSSDQ